MKFKSTCPHCGDEIEVSIFAESTQATEKKKEELFDGYVYLLYSPTNNLYKIGRAKQFRNRCGEISKQSPVEIKLLHSFKSKNSKIAENILHKKYSTLRVLGEWFSLSENDASYIRSIADGGL